MSRTVEEVEKEISNLRSHMQYEEIANDYYYTKGTYKEDSQKLKELEDELANISRNS